MAAERCLHRRSLPAARGAGVSGSRGDPPRPPRGSGCVLPPVQTSPEPLPKVVVIVSHRGPRAPPPRPPPPVAPRPPAFAQPIGSAVVPHVTFVDLRQSLRSAAAAFRFGWPSPPAFPSGLMPLVSR